MVLKDGQLQSGGAIEVQDRTIVMLPTFASPKGYKSSLVDSCKSSSVHVVSVSSCSFHVLAVFLLSTDNQNIIMTHCDKKPRGKVGGSAISVYQALLHPPIESLGTRLHQFIIGREAIGPLLREC